MPAPDTSNILFTIAHPDLYERNPFNVLNLSVNATAKDIRRRREDIEAAFDAGTEAEEFAGMIPADEGRTPPTREVVHDLFAALDVPEKRIAYALFWFWPAESDSASGARASRSRDPNAAFRNTKSVGDWEKRALGTSRSESVVERHNLAVYRHLMALSGERSSRQFSSIDAHLQGTRWEFAFQLVPLRYIAECRWTLMMLRPSEKLFFEDSRNDMEYVWKNYLGILSNTELLLAYYRTFCVTVDWLLGLFDERMTCAGSPVTARGAGVVAGASRTVSECPLCTEEEATIATQAETTRMLTDTISKLAARS